MSHTLPESDQNRLEPAPSVPNQTAPGSSAAADRPRVAFVVQRCGLEVNGGAELLCRQIAGAMSTLWQVDILTTCALDYMTWANHYPPGGERIGEVLIRRFPVDSPRDVPSFNRLSEQIVPRLKKADLEEQEAWMRAQGPMSSDLLQFLGEHRSDYTLFMFFGYLYAQSYFGLPLVAERSILVPCAHDEWPIHLTMWDRFFALPKGILFNTVEEEAFARHRFPSLAAPARVAGIGIDAPANPDPLRFRTSTGIKGPILLYVGRVDPSKGCEEMFRWFLSAKSDRDLPHKLVLVGKAAMPIPESPDIVALGFVDEQLKFDAMAASDWLLIPSHYESLSIVLLEAWSIGTPALVKSESAVLAGHCARSNAGVAADSFDQWERVILQTSPASRHTLGQEGKAYVMETYTWERVKREIAALAAEISTSPQSPFQQSSHSATFHSGSPRHPKMSSTQTDYELTCLFPLRPPLPLPDGLNDKQALAFLQGVRVEGAPEAELRNYCTTDWRRFVYTYGLARDCRGAALEIGGNPYFTTALLLRFTELQLTVTNYFNSTFSSKSSQDIRLPNKHGDQADKITIPFDHFNSELEPFPYEDNSFEVVLFCEVIEHMQSDPLAVLREVNRILKPGGRLVLTTPNAARLENLARITSGANIYDPYSGYGPYGRHNREFIMHELYLLLQFAGFDLEIQSTADVHENRTMDFVSKGCLDSLIPQLRHRINDLGQYLFTRSIKQRTPKPKRPRWLYRSFPEHELA